MAEDNRPGVMKITELFLRIVFPGILVMLVYLESFAQADTAITVSDTSSKHSLYAGAGYGSNMIYLGSTISGNQPFTYGSLTYGFNNEFFASVSAVHLKGNKPFFGFYSGSLNYSHVFNSWFDISAGVSGYKFAASLSDNFYDNFVYTDATLGIDWRLIYSQLSAGILFYNGSSAYFRLNNSRYFQLPDLFNGKLHISLDPYLNFLSGTIVTAESSGGATIMTVPFNGKGKRRPRPSGTVYKERFGLVETDFGIPVSFRVGRFTLEAEPGYVFQAKSSEYAGSGGFLFLLNGYFKIF